MSTEYGSIVTFLKEVMRTRHQLPSQLATDLGVSHTTVLRWLSGSIVPGFQSCCKLAEFTGVPLQKVLSIVGQLPEIMDSEAANWPEFREYAQRKDRF